MELETKTEREDRRQCARLIVESDEDFHVWLKTQYPSPEDTKLRASCRKIRMFPNAKQARILDRWILATKKTWNMATDLVNKGKANPIAAELDRRVITKAALAASRANLPLAMRQSRSAVHVCRAPAEIRKKVTRRFDANYRAAVSNLGENKRFRMHPVPYDDRGNGAFEVEHQYAKLSLTERWVRFHDPETACEKAGVLFPGRIKLQKKGRLAHKEKRPLAFDDHDMSVVKRHGRYFLCVPHFEHAAAAESAPDDHVIDEHATVALDPGVRVFATGWCPGTGQTVEYGRQKELQSRLKRARDHEVGIGKRLDDKKKTMLRVAEKYGGISARNLRKKQWFVEGKLRAMRHKHSDRQDNIVREFHLKTATELLKRYRHIILPRFSSKSIHKLNVSEATKEYARRLNHFKFRERLLQKTWRHPGTVVWLCGEQYTTMMCGRCGINNRNVKGAEIFKCAKCGATAPRDAHAARNIYLKIGFGSHQTE